ncbi:hypothetical protein [Chamaesiphon polymorphus]|uniref:hypothetical protein n=1 Tax=Chamaesiphon polymorphus TaxID=2107691 RepID=UPI0011B1CA42|nr:hypothetical protein [Chamaesiphon polymorphus]
MTSFPVTCVFLLRLGSMCFPDRVWGLKIRSQIVRAVKPIHIAVDRYSIATCRTVDRLLRYIPTIYHQCFTCYERVKLL